VDVSLKGTSVEPDVDDMEAAYGEGTTPADVLTGRIKAPTQAQLLYNAISQLESQAAR
jgi:lipid-binding SYLF domain-containing protein